MRWLLAVSVLASAQSFERDLQPVFRKHCYACHAANVKMGSLDVETLDGLLRGGNQGTIVVPGKAAESRLFRTLTGALEPVMPMGAPRLSDAELAIVKRWIDAGAKAGAAGLGWGGTVIAAGRGGAVRVLGSPDRVLGNVGAVRAVAVSLDGEWVAAAGRLEIRMWNARTGKELMVPEGGAEALRFLPGGALLAVRDGGMWDVRRGARLSALPAGYSEWTFSPDGKRIAAVDGEGRVRIINGPAGPDETLTRLAWQGDRIAAGMEDGRVRLLRASDLAPLAILGIPGEPVTGLAFDGDGLRLAVMREDGSMRIEDIQ